MSRTPTLLNQARVEDWRIEGSAALRPKAHSAHKPETHD
jgi:hypothetical protein